MKKILALALAVIMMAFALTACGEPANGGDSTTPDNGDPTDPSVGDTTPSGGNTTPEPDYFDDPSGIRFEQCNETVYVDGTMSGLWLRSEPDFDNEELKEAFAEYGDEMKRIGKHETWSKVVFEGEEYFASSKYLSTEKPEEFIFAKRNETVIVNQGANYRSFPSLDDEYKVDSFEEGTELTRTGILFDKENNPEGDLGWSEILFEGHTYYMRNSVLSIKDEASEDVVPGAISAKDAYEAVKKFFEGMTDISIEGHIVSKVAIGEESEEAVTTALLRAKGLGRDSFACYMYTNGTEIVFLDGYYYMKDTSGTKAKIKVDRAEVETLFGVDVFVSNAFEAFKSATVKTEGDFTVLTLKGISEKSFIEDVLGITRDFFESDAEYEAYLSALECDYENYTETFTIDKNGKVTSFSISYSYSEQAYGMTIDYGYSEDNTVSETVADIKLPEDADSYITLG